MAGVTLKVIAQRAGVAPATVSRVLNKSEKVALGTRKKILSIMKDLEFTPNAHAVNLRRKRSNEESATDSEGVPRLTEEVFTFNPEEARALAQRLVELRGDLDMLKKHTERIQASIDTLQETYSRRLFQSAAHRPA